MSRITVTESELLRAMRAETAIDEDVPPEAMTVSELCERLNLGTNAVAKRLARYRAEGRLQEYRVMRSDVHGRHHPMRAYVLLPEPPKRKRA